MEHAREINARRGNSQTILAGLMRRSHKPPRAAAPPSIVVVLGCAEIITTEEERCCCTTGRMHGNGWRVAVPTSIDPQDALSYGDWSRT